MSTSAKARTAPVAAVSARLDAMTPTTMNHARVWRRVRAATLNSTGARDIKDAAAFTSKVPSAIKAAAAAFGVRMWKRVTASHSRGRAIVTVLAAKKFALR